MCTSQLLGQVNIVLQLNILVGGAIDALILILLLLLFRHCSLGVKGLIFVHIRYIDVTFGVDAQRARLQLGMRGRRRCNPTRSIVSGWQPRRRSDGIFISIHLYMACCYCS